MSSLTDLQEALAAAVTSSPDHGKIMANIMQAVVAAMQPDASETQSPRVDMHTAVLNSVVLEYLRATGMEATAAVFATECGGPAACEVDRAVAAVELQIEPELGQCDAPLLSVLAALPSALAMGAELYEEAEEGEQYSGTGSYAEEDQADQAVQDELAALHAQLPLATEPRSIQPTAIQFNRGL